MKILIIDDEAFARELLKQQLEEYCAGMVEIVGLADSAIEGLKLIRQAQPQLVFLDVEMPMGTGFDLLELSGERHFEVVFTTAHRKYALNAMKHQATDFLLKPIDGDALALAVRNAGIRLDNRKAGEFTQNKKLKLKSSRETLLVLISDILYLEAHGRYSKLHLSGGTVHLISRNIGEFEEELGPYRFFRIHKSLLVNLEKVARLHRDHEKLELEDSTILPVSKRRQSVVVVLLKSRAGT